MSNFDTGVQAAEEASSGGGNFHRTEFLSIKNGEHAIVRFIDDGHEIITVDQHNNIPTRPAPVGAENWPNAMGSVCRMSLNKAGNRVFPSFPDCWICNQWEANGKETKSPFKPRGRSWGRAVVRKAVMNEEGRRIGFEDVTEEVDIDGQTVTIPKIVICNFSYNNFWGNMAGTLQAENTWMHCDWQITRKGEKLDTAYLFHAFAPAMVDFGDGAGAIAYDVRDQRVRDYYETHAPDLGEFVTGRADDDFYATFFDTRVPQPERKKKSDDDGSATQGPQPAPAPAPDNDVSAEQMANLAARVTPAAPQAVPAATQDQAAAPAAAPAPFAPAMALTT